VVVKQHEISGDALPDRKHIVVATSIVRERE